MRSTPKVLITVPLRALLEQFAPDFPGFCKVGTGYNKKIDFNAKGFIAVTDSVYLLKNLEFDAIFVDEAHHPLPTGMPKCKDLYQLSATHKDEPDFRYSMGQAIEDGIVSDYDITVPVISQHHAYVCLADLLLKQAGRFRRVLAYCNTVAQAKGFQMVLEELGLAAWHINAKTRPTIRQAIIAEFAGKLQKPVHVLVTVEVLGEGINIPNADTCMFVEPRQSYTSIVQAIGRVLRPNSAKTIAHIVPPGVVVPNVKSAEGSSEQGRAGHDAASEQAHVFLSSVPAHRSGMKSLGGYASSTSSPHENGAQTTNTFKSTADIFDSLSLQLVEQEAASGPWPSQSRHDNRKVPEKSFWRGSVRDPRQRAVSSLRPRVSSGGEAKLPVDSLRLNSRGKPATVRCAASGQAQLPDSLSQAGAGSSNTISRRGVSTSQNSDTVLGPETEAARPAGSRSRYLEADPLDGIRRNGRTKPTSPEVREQPHLASKERGCSDEEARHSDGFANRSPSPTGNTKQDLQTPPSLASEAQPHRMMRVALRREKQTQLTFGSSDGVEAFDKKYENQLERFLGALVQADHRWIGAAGHRIQIVDCSLSLQGELGVEGFMKEVYGRLDAVLSQRDAWETRFRELEAFAEKNGKLPRWWGAGCDRAETVLGNWLNNQRRRVTSQQMPAHRLQRLLNAISDLVRRRAEGWMAGGLVGRFKQNCRELKEYIEMNGKLPTATRTKGDSSSNRLARWLADLRDKRLYDKPERRKMLEEVDPLVKERLQEWDDRELKIDLARWEKQLEKVLHITEVHGRLPERTLENAEYEWLRVQLRRFDALPPELAKRLRGSHPLIAAKTARTSGGRNKKGRCHSQGGPVQRKVHQISSASSIRISVKFVLCEMCEVIWALGSKEGPGVDVCERRCVQSQRGAFLCCGVLGSDNLASGCFFFSFGYPRGQGQKRCNTIRLPTEGRPSKWNSF